METEKKKLNISLSPEVAAALRKFAFESTGHMRGVSDIAEKAIRQFLETKGLRLKGRFKPAPSIFNGELRCGFSQYPLKI